MDGFSFKSFYGIVAQDYDGNPEGIIRVSRPDKSPFVDGDISHTNENVVFTTEDPWGSRTSSSCKITNTVPATFFGNNSNISIPRVVVGEQVELVTYGGSKTYYWKPMRKNEDLRKNELYDITCANSPSRKKTLNKENSYGISINTYQGSKKVHIYTSLSDGESFKYDLILDPENKSATLQDNAGNKFNISSANKTVTMVNADGTKVEAASKNLFLDAPDSIYITAANNVVIKGTQLQTVFKTGIVAIVKLILKCASIAKA